jgi:hypothetical protein
LSNAKPITNLNETDGFSLCPTHPTALSMNIAVDVGLVFAVPLGEQAFGFGQLIAWQRPIFSKVFSNN